MAGREGRQYTERGQTVVTRRRKLILVGGGGHCRSCIDVIEQEGRYEIAGILDQYESIGQKVLGYSVVGSDDSMQEYAREGYSFLITVGQTRTSSLRKKLYTKLQTYDAHMATVISPRAYVSRHASLGKGTIIMHDALVNANASIGANCIVNSKALIEHDARIEDFCHISTAAVINGGVVVKEGSFFGSNAVSKEYVETEINDFIKAGTTFRGQP